MHEFISEAEITRQLSLVELQAVAAATTAKPLVIVVATATSQTTKTEHHTLVCRRLKKHLVPKHKIYVHGFSGEQEALNVWVNAFPEVLIGVGTDTRISDQVLRSRGLNHLLVETGSPPPGVPNTPFTVGS